jgi:ATP phosphoribosyltransferase
MTAEKLAAAPLLRLAIQKSGRLFEATKMMLEECDVEFEASKSTLRTRASGLPLELYFLRDDDISAYVAEGVADAGVVGLNALEEANVKVTIAERLGFGACRLCLAVPREVDYGGLDFFRGKRITTSHPHILKSYLATQKIDAHVHAVSGSVEIAPSIGLADAICDLVSTGGTLAGNGLKEVETILASEAVLITRRDLEPARNAIVEQLLFRLTAVRRAKHNKYIMLNAPNAALGRISALLPGSKSPSILPLAETGWSSLHAVVADTDFWRVIGELKAAGAQGILVLPIEKMID